MAVKGAKPLTASGSSDPLLEAFASPQPSLESCYQEQQAQLTKALRRKPKLSKKRSKELLKTEQWLKDRANGKRPQVKGPAPGLELRIQISKTKYVTLPAEQAHLYAKIKDVIRKPGADSYIPPEPVAMPELTEANVKRNKVSIPENKHKMKGKTARQKRSGVFN